MRHLAAALLRITSYIALASAPATAQSARDTARAIAMLDREIAAADSLLEAEVWPGYHFARLGVMYVIPTHAKIAAHWPGAPPTGMQPLEDFPAVFWTDTGAVSWEGGLPVASLAVSPQASRGAIAGLAMHEAFHAFEVTQRRPGRRFGSGENSLLTARYPVFDAHNEAAFAVESKLLRAAVLARSRAEAIAHARQFLAVRALRQARLDSSFVNYEMAAELHEGLAQYTLLRGLAVIGQRYASYRDGAARERETEGDLLANPLARTNLSPRRRAYATGSYLGLLLDRLAGSAWKQRVMNDDEWVQDILAEVVGRAAVSAATESELERMLPKAVEAAQALRNARRELRDSLLANARLMLMIDPAALPRHFDWCGFDPQNLLASGSGQLLHMRMLNLCSSGKQLARIFQPAIEDEFSGRVQVPLDPSGLQLTVDGRPAELPPPGGSVTGALTLQTGSLEITLTRGLIVRGEGTLLVVPLP